MDPFSKLNLKLDSSLRMAFALQNKGCKVYFSEQNGLSWSSGSKYAHSNCAEIKFKDGPESAYLADFTEKSLSRFSGIHMRKDPPFDLQYVATTWLLDAVPESTKVINSPSALRGLNEKLSIYHFPEFTDKALLSSRPEEILRFIEETCAGNAIVKPLDLFGGKGVIKISVDNENSRQAVLSKLRVETAEGTLQRLVQPFNNLIHEGEVRAFAAAGEPLSYCLKKPIEGSYLANTGSGATLHPYIPDEKVKNLVKKVSEKLLEFGVFIVGYDIIGGLLSEINITSPRLLLPESEDDSVYYDRLSEHFIKYCSSK